MSPRWLAGFNATCMQHEERINRSHVFWHPEKSLNIQHRFNILSYTSNYKYLGMKLDQTLALRRVCIQKGMCSPAPNYWRFSQALQMYDLTSLMYCSILTNILTKFFVEKVSKFEKRACTMIYKHLNINNLKKVSIRTLQKRKLCEQVFKCTNGNVCSNFTNYFDVMTNNTRNCNKLIRVPLLKLECCKKSFCFAGSTEFNKLPFKIRNASTSNEFTLLFNMNFKI